MKTLKIQSELALQIVSGEFYSKDTNEQMNIMKETALFNSYSLEWLANNSDEFLVMFINSTNRFVRESIEKMKDLKPAK